VCVIGRVHPRTHCVGKPGKRGDYRSMKNCRRRFPNRLKVNQPIDILIPVVVVVVVVIFSSTPHGYHAPFCLSTIVVAQCLTTALTLSPAPVDGQGDLHI
jgi:hypothetical protein